MKKEHLEILKDIIGRVQVVDDRVVEPEASVLVCSDTRWQPDDEDVTCDECGTHLIRSISSPKTSKVICIDCAGPEFFEAVREGKARMTKAQMADIQLAAEGEAEKGGH